MTYEEEIKDLIKCVGVCNKGHQLVISKYSYTFKAIKAMYEENKKLKRRLEIDTCFNSKGEVIPVENPETFPDKIECLETEIKHYYEPKIEELRERIAELEKADEWQPIETAPNRTDILLTDGVYVEKGYIVDFGKSLRSVYISNNGDYGDGGYGQDYDTTRGCCRYDEPTHWKPLPTPPEEYE